MCVWLVRVCLWPLYWCLSQCMNNFQDAAEGRESAMFSQRAIDIITRDFTTIAADSSSISKEHFSQLLERHLVRQPTSAEVAMLTRHFGETGLRLHNWLQWLQQFPQSTAQTPTPVEQHRDGEESAEEGAPSEQCDDQEAASLRCVISLAAHNRCVYPLFLFLFLWLSPSFQKLAQVYVLSSCPRCVSCVSV